VAATPDHRPARGLSSTSSMAPRSGLFAEGSAGTHEGTELLLVGRLQQWDAVWRVGRVGTGACRGSCYAPIMARKDPPSLPENTEGVRRMVAGWQAVEGLEREERRQAGPDAMAVRGALELMDLFGALHGWPPPENEARRRDSELVRSRWVRVRSFYQAHGQAAQQKNP